MFAQGAVGRALVHFCMSTVPGIAETNDRAGQWGQSMDSKGAQLPGPNFEKLHVEPGVGLSVPSCVLSASKSQMPELSRRFPKMFKQNVKLHCEPIFFSAAKLQPEPLSERRHLLWRGCFLTLQMCTNLLRYLLPIW